MKKNSKRLRKAKLEIREAAEGIRQCVCSIDGYQDAVFRKKITAGLCKLAKISNFTFPTENTYEHLVNRPYLIEWLILETVPQAFEDESDSDHSLKILDIWLRICRDMGATLKRWKRQRESIQTTRPTAPTDDALTGLRERLEELKEEGDITNETAIFQLERRIYDLEHSTPDSKWPEVIGEEVS